MFGVELRDALTVISMVAAIWIFDRRRSQQQALRDQKIDIVLFGTPGTRGLVRNVDTLRVDMYDSKQGEVPRLRHMVNGIRQALQINGIETPDQ